MPKRRNTVGVLFDGPVYRDWMFWMAVGWGLLTALAISTNTEPSALPTWLDTLLATIVFVVIFGLFPAWLRLLFRRWRWRWRQERRPSPAQSPTQTSRAGPTVTSPAGNRPARPSFSGNPPGAGTTAVRPMPAGSSPPPQYAHSKLSASEALARACETLPHPVARAVRALRGAHTARDQYERVLDAAEILAATVSVTVVALLTHQLSDRSEREDRHRLAQRVSALRSVYVGGGAMFGTWTTWLRELGSVVDDQKSVLPGLREALLHTQERLGINEHLNVLRLERNRAAHGDKPRSQHESASRATEFVHHLERALVKAEFLRNAPWLLILSCEYRPRMRNFEVAAHYVMGDRPDFERRAFTWPEPVANDMFYLLVPAGRPVALSPFVASCFCAQCQQVEVCYAYRTGREAGPLVLKSFARGHEITDAALGDDIRALPRK